MPFLLKWSNVFFPECNFIFSARKAPVHSLTDSVVCWNFYNITDEYGLVAAANNWLKRHWFGAEFSLHVFEPTRNQEEWDTSYENNWHVRREKNQQ